MKETKFVFNTLVALSTLLGVACASAPQASVGEQRVEATPNSEAPASARSKPSMTLMPNVWMDSGSRYPAHDPYNAGQLIPQAESWIAVNPNNPNNIIASAVYWGEVLRGPPAEANSRGTGGATLASLDGGRTWTRVSTPPFARYNLRVAFSRRYGDAYRYGGGGRVLPWIDVQRSGDKGLTWISHHTERVVEGFRTIDTDQGNMVVDNWPDSPFYGRIYLAPHNYRFWYNDARGAPQAWQASERPFTSSGTVLTSGFEVLPDGTVALAFRKYERNTKNDWELHVYLVLSSDGGKTFTAPRHMVQLDFNRFAPPADSGRVFYSGVGTENKASFTTDPSSGRLYCTYVKRVDGLHRIFAISSSDKGITWSAPVAVSTSSRTSNQYQHRAAVIDLGELGVLWLDTRHNPGDTGYDAYFATSDDRAQTFREVRLSERSSKPAWDFRQHQLPREKWVVPGFDARRHLTGGDYIGLRADPAGDFVMTWPDARNENRQQMYFSKVSFARYNHR